MNHTIVEIFEGILDYRKGNGIVALKNRNQEKTHDYP